MSGQFYYPYFSARCVYPDPLLEMQLTAAHHSKIRQELTERQVAVRLKQQQLHTDRIRQYQQDLRNKQRERQMVDHLHYQQQIDEEYRSRLLEDRLNQLRYSHRKDRMDELQKQVGSLSRQKNVYEAKETNRKSKEEIQNERKISQYQHELLQKIQSCKSHRKQSNYLQDCNQNKRNKNLSGNQQVSVKSVPKQDNNVIVNRKYSNLEVNHHKQKDKHQGLKNLKKYTKHHSFTLCPKGDSTINFDNYQTIDVDAKKNDRRPMTNQSTKKKRNFSIFQSDRKQKNPYQVQNKNYFNKKTNPNTRKNNNYAKTKPIVTKNPPFHFEQIQTNALQKIQNRLKLSSIVYKDSRWASLKHQSDHLINTYEREQRGRKDIKDNLNNHPQILKKHRLVVSSR